MSVPVVILDLGSTLVRGPAVGPAHQLAERLNLDDGSRRTLNRALMTVDYPGPEPVAALVGGLSGRGADAEVRSAVEDVWTRQETDARPIAGALDALRRLQAYGLPLALVSNIWLPYLRGVRRHFGEFFDEHVPVEHQFFSFHEGCRKPSPEIFARALAATRAKPEDTVMIGDTYATDIAPAISLGMKTVWLLEQPNREKVALTRVINLEWPRPSLTLESLAGLTEELIESLILGSSPSETEADHRPAVLQE
jgi:HAD superfamily hydrolase (TIGR01509 family)